MPKQNADGSTTYRWPDELSRLTLNGMNMLNLAPEEARVWPSGYGWVITRKRTEIDTVKRYIDGSYRQTIWRGQIEVELAEA